MYLKLKKDSETNIFSLMRMPWIVGSDKFLSSPSLGMLIPKKVRVNLLVDFVTDGLKALGENATISIVALTETQDSLNKPVTYLIDIPHSFGYNNECSLTKRLENISAHWYTDEEFYKVYFVISGHTLPQEYSPTGNSISDLGFTVKIKAELEITYETGEWISEEAMYIYLLNFRMENSNLLPLDERRFIEIPKKTLDHTVSAKDIADIF